MHNILLLLDIARQRREALAAEVRADRLDRKETVRSAVSLSLFAAALFALTLLLVSLPLS